MSSILPEIKDPEVLKKAIDRYGVNAQTDRAIEEMSELTKAILKNRREWRHDNEEEHRERIKSVVEEAADVLITVAQVIMMYDHRGEVQGMVDYKIDRLRERMERRGYE